MFKQEVDVHQHVKTGLVAGLWGVSVVAHSHQDQPLAAAKPTCPLHSSRPRPTEQLLCSDNKNRRDDGTKLVIAEQQKQSVGLRGLTRQKWSLQIWAPVKYGQRDRSEQANPFAANVSACWHRGSSSASGPVIFQSGHICEIPRPAPARSLIESALRPTLGGGVMALVLASHFRGSRSPLGWETAVHNSKFNSNPGACSRRFGSCNHL